MAAFAISALLHLLFLLLYPHLFGPPDVGHAPAAAGERSSPPGLEVLNLVEVAELPPLQRPDRPLEEPRQPAPVTPRTAAGQTGGEPGAEARGDEVDAGEEARAAAEVLRPRAGDPRLTQPLPRELTELSDRRLAQLRVAWLLEEMGDSAAAAAEALRRGTDWTYTDGEGKKWGVSPGKIHLGDITLPLPFGFSAPVNSDAARRARIDAEIDRAAGTAAARANMRERARAIRERKDRERAEDRRVVDPDTTRGGGGQP